MQNFDKKGVTKTHLEVIKILLYSNAYCLTQKPFPRNISWITKRNEVQGSVSCVDYYIISRSKIILKITFCCILSLSTILEYVHSRQDADLQTLFWFTILLQMFNSSTVGLHFNTNCYVLLWLWMNRNPVLLLDSQLFMKVISSGGVLVAIFGHLISSR